MTVCTLPADQADPREGQREQPDQVLHSLGVGQVSRFQVEASRLQSRKHRFYFPPPTVQPGGLLWIDPPGGQDKKLVAFGLAGVCRGNTPDYHARRETSRIRLCPK